MPNTVSTRAPLRPKKRSRTLPNFSTNTWVVDCSFYGDIKWLTVVASGNGSGASLFSWKLTVKNEGREWTKNVELCTSGF